MNSVKQSLYLISNACADIYEENSLVDFKNKIPTTIQVGRNEGIEVALSYLGISNNFKNIYTPPNNLPSFMISNCFLPEIGLENGRPVQIPVRFMFWDKEDGNEYIPCKWFKYHFENKYYSLDDIKKYFQDVSAETKTNIEFTDDMRLEIKSKPLTMNNFWILIHKTMIDSFNFKNVDVKTEVEFIDNPNVQIYNVVTGDGSTTVLRKSYYKGELYYTYRIKARTSQKEKDYFLTSDESNILERIYPSVIKVVCDNVSPQIFNSTYSRDLVVFCPDFAKKEEYSAIEFSSKQYVPISNTNISEFSIKLVDQNNYPIQLLPGPATLLKMDLRLRRPEKKSFNIRLTSDVTSEYPENNNSIFKVKLPSQIQLNRNWRVSLTSISNPNVYSTLLEDESTRSIAFRQISPIKNKSVKFSIPHHRKIYTAKELLTFIHTKLQESNIGAAEIEDEKCIFTFESDMIVIASNYLLKILGYHGFINEEKKVSLLLFTQRENHELSYLCDKTHKILPNDDGNFEISFENRIDLDYLKPNYIIIYSNIVSKSIIGGIMSNILKVVPIKANNNEYYVISDFKHKEYYELQNTEIGDIEIHLRSHDGLPINFASYQDTILNLEFSNYLDITS